MTDIQEKHPYMALPSRQMWRSAVGLPKPSEICDLASPKFKLKADDIIGTAGSCFAQHISRILRQRGFNFFDAEPAPALLKKARRGEYGYDLYSARYGNVYTAAQLRQLIERAFGRRTPDVQYWQRDDRFFDPFRPQIEPDGFASKAELEADVRSHLASVVRLFRKINVFVFTLGLTESWRAISDGSVFPMAPGIRGVGEFSNARYEFVNFKVTDVIRDLAWTFNFLRRANPDLRFILTVSPVPLTATASGEHVLTATTYSKSVLRAAAGELVQKRPDVDYFPSFELITAPVFGGAAFAANRREVLPEAVARVMEHFFATFVEAGAVCGRRRSEESDLAERSDEELVCEEAILDSYTNK